MQEQDPLGELSAALFFQNVLQFHQQREIILCDDNLVLWKTISEKDAGKIRKVTQTTGTFDVFDPRSDISGPTSRRVSACPNLRE